MMTPMLVSSKLARKAFFSLCESWFIKGSSRNDTTTKYSLCQKQDQHVKQCITARAANFKAVLPFSICVRGDILFRKKRGH